MRTAKEIRRYLKQQHWYKEYVRCTKESFFPYDDGVDILFVRGYKGIMTIMGAFTWRNAPSGYKAWSHRDNLFLVWYDKGEKKYESKKVPGKPSRSSIGSRTD